MYTSRGLDDWYRAINRMYLDRNFYRHPESIFAHIVEIMGGLSLLASDKTKPGVDPQAYIAKAIAWWLALCGKMRIKSVEKMVWSKYPYVCPYCLQFPHKGKMCTQIKMQQGSPEWTKVHDQSKANKSKMPHALGEWLNMFSSIYEITQVEDYTAVFARFTEEIGELSEATRLFQLAPGYFFSEASDFFAWLMHLQALFFYRSKINKDEGEKLELAMWNQYPGKCRDCNNELCTCPPVLRKTFGRIAHDMPILFNDGEEGTNPLLNLTEAMEVFEISSKTILIGQKQLNVDSILIKEVYNTIKDLQIKILDLKNMGGEQMMSLMEILDRIKTLAESERITQQSITDLAQTIAKLPVERRNHILEFLQGVSSSVWAGALIEAVKTLATS